MKRTNGNFGSALILTVVLTSLLATVAVVFVMLARVDKLSTSAIAENKQLNLAVDSVIAKIADELGWDTPSQLRRQEYYDYPNHNINPGPDGILGTPDDLTIDIGPDLTIGTADDLYYYGVSDNIWLANLEPEIVDCCETPAIAGDDLVGFRHITDLYGRLGYLYQCNFPDAEGDRVSFRNMRAMIIPQSLPILQEGDKADADGDGIADSRWVIVPDMISKGRDIYAAVRVVDNGGMLNVNTGYKFDPANPGLNGENIDGSSQMHINLMTLTQRGTTYPPQEEEDRLWTFRCGSAPNDIRLYERNVIWQYNRPAGNYTPFDISDELELRNRFLINLTGIDSRAENVWTDAFKNPNLRTPVPWNDDPAVRQADLIDWFFRSKKDIPGPNDIYSYRHIGTTYNMDRIIDPNGYKMFGVNTDPNAQLLYQKLLNSIDLTLPAATVDLLRTEFAQVAANIKDYGDNDSNVTTVYDACGVSYYGFERPGICISELVRNAVVEDPNDPNTVVHRSYAIELRKQFAGANPDWWRVVIEGPSGLFAPIYVTDFGQDASRYRVIVFEDPCASLASTIVFSDSPGDGETGVDPNVILRWAALPVADANYSYDVYFGLDHNSVRDATSAVDPNGDYQGSQNYNDVSYDPYGPAPGGAMGLNTTYYWRIDDVDPNGNIIGSSGVWQFTTWAAEPNSIYTIIDANDPPVFDLGTTIRLERLIPPGIWISVDAVPLPPDVLPPWLIDPNSGFRSFKRDISGQLWIKRIWDYDEIRMLFPSLGNSDGHYFAGDPNFIGGNTNPIQANVANYFNNIGEIGKVLRKSAYIDPSNTIGLLDDELTARLNLADLNVQEFFNYLTRFDPTIDGVDNDGDGLGWSTDPNGFIDPDELKVAGRININTAPWYVMAQLPWVSPPLAQAIVAYREKLDLSVAGGPDYSSRPGYLGFGSIGHLNRVAFDPNVNCRIDYYARPDGAIGDQLTFPDLTAGSGRSLGDGVPDDFEERDLIFARISDLVTVRSDVFTAYILVRIGTDGPQKRVVAILDRSDAYTPAGRVRVRALHPVPDPR